MELIVNRGDRVLTKSQIFGIQTSSLNAFRGFPTHPHKVTWPPHRPRETPWTTHPFGLKGVSEVDHYIYTNQPTLNKDRGHYKSPSIYGSILMTLTKVSNSGEFGHSAEESCSENSSRYAIFLCCDQKLKLSNWIFLPKQMDFHLLSSFFL